MRPTARCFTLLLLAISPFVSYTAAKAVAVPGAAPAPYPAANPSPNPTPDAALPAEILEAHRDPKRWRTTGGGCYWCNPSPSKAWGSHWHSHNWHSQNWYSQDWQSHNWKSTPTSWWQPTPTHKWHHKWGGGGGHRDRTTTIQKTVYSGVTTVVKPSAAEAQAGAVCSTIFAKGNGLPVTTQGSCGLVVIKQSGAERATATGVGIVGAMAFGWAAVLASRLLFW